MYAGVGEDIGLEEESNWLNHQHHIPDRDSEDYWDNILSYLHLKQLPNVTLGSPGYGQGPLGLADIRSATMAASSATGSTRSPTKDMGAMMLIF